jgi:hypothetical protein
VISAVVHVTFRAYLSPRAGWVYTEPKPLNLAMNLRTGDASSYPMDLMREDLRQPRLKPDTPVSMVIDVPVVSDFKLHDITSGPEDTNAEPVDMNQAAWSPKYRTAN